MGAAAPPATPAAFFAQPAVVRVRTDVPLGAPDMPAARLAAVCSENATGKLFLSKALKHTQMCQAALSRPCAIFAMQDWSKNEWA